MKKQLAIKPIERIAQVVPKPTKTEIIEALVQTKLQELRRERSAHEAMMRGLQSDIEDALKKEAIKSIENCTIEIDLGYNSGSRIFGVKARILLDNISNEIRQKLVKYHELPSSIRIDESRVRKEIKARMAGIVSSTSQERIQSLIENPETSKALALILCEIGVSKN